MVTLVISLLFMVKVVIMVTMVPLVADSYIGNCMVTLVLCNGSHGSR